MGVTRSKRLEPGGRASRPASHRELPPILRGQALRAATIELFAKPNVLGAYIGKKRRRNRITDETALVCLVAEKKPLRHLVAQERVPRRISWAPTSRESRTVATDVVVPLPFRTASIAAGPGDRVDQPRPGTIGVAVLHPRYGETITTAGHVFMQPGWTGTYEWEEAKAPFVQVANVGGDAATISGRLLKVAITETQDYALVRPDGTPCRNAYQDDYVLGDAYEASDGDLGKQLFALASGGARTTKLVGCHGTVPIQDHPIVRHAILVDRCTFGGDSGCCLIDGDRRVWGLLVGFNGDSSVFMSIYDLLGPEQCQLL